MGTLKIACRSQKPRLECTTLLSDRGIGIKAWDDALDVASAYVDIVKLGIGTAYVMQNLQREVTFLQARSISVVQMCRRFLRKFFLSAPEKDRSGKDTLPRVFPYGRDGRKRPCRDEGGGM